MGTVIELVFDFTVVTQPIIIEVKTFAESILTNYDMLYANKYK